MRKIADYVMAAIEKHIEINEKQMYTQSLIKEQLVIWIKIVVEPLRSLVGYIRPVNTLKIVAHQ